VPSIYKKPSTIFIMGKNTRSYTLFLKDGRRLEIKNSSASLSYIVVRNEQLYSSKVEKVYVDQYIPYIREGTVIDHIPEGKGIEVYNYLSKVVPQDKVILLARSLPSNKLGKKDLIKVCEYRISKEEARNVFSMFEEAEQKPTINYIEDWTVYEKIREKV